MNIKDYFNQYGINKKQTRQLNKDIKVSDTISNFYDDSIKGLLLVKDSVLAWHKMLMEYVERGDAILWIRRFEKGEDKKANIYRNRRACLTRFADGFSYVFVGNNDAQEIFNMVSKGVVPNCDEFLAMMKNFTFPLSYYSGGKSSKVCEESLIAAYPRSTRTSFNGVVSGAGWYFAHIHSAMDSSFLMPDGTIKTLSAAEKNHIFPKGEVSDWQVDPSTGKHIRRLDYSLTAEEKAIVKADFLRFVDPLNYFLTPAKKHETHDPIAGSKDIGEYENLIRYVEDKWRDIYGKSVMDEFSKKVLALDSDIHENGTTVINIRYGKSLLKNASSATKHTVANSKAAKKGTSKGSVGSFARELFTDLLLKGKLTPEQINQLEDKAFCTRTFGIYYPVLIDLDKGSDHPRYYVPPVKDHYKICREWHEENRAKLEKWKKDNGF